MEDLNYLLRRQQEERSRAEGACCPKAREAHEKLAELYENRLGDAAPDKVTVSARAVERSWELLKMPFSKPRD